jgi:hypothetical protein
MTFSDLFQDVEDWFWKLEYNPETNSHELYLGIPNDWIYSGNGKDVNIDLIHQMEENSIIKISALENTELSIDDIIDTAKLLVGKNKELEKRKEDHKKEMERLRDELIAKERNFLTYIDTIKDTKGTGIVENDGVSDGVNDGVSEDATEEVEVVVEETTEGITEGIKEIVDEVANNFMKDLEKSK